MEKLHDYYAPPIIRRIKTCRKCQKPAASFSIEGLCADCHEAWQVIRDQAWGEWIGGKDA